MADAPLADHDQALATATQLHAGGDSARALEALPDLVAARPDDLAVRLLLARCLQTNGAPAVAMAAADAAVACDPSSWEAHALVAHAAIAIDPERARMAAEKALALAPHEPAARLALTAVQAAADAPAAETESRSAAATGGLAAAFGRRGSGSRGSTTSDPAVAEPRLEPRLPAALDPARSAAPPPPLAEHTAPEPPAPLQPAPPRPLAMPETGQTLTDTLPPDVAPPGVAPPAVAPPAVAPPGVAPPVGEARPPEREHHREPVLPAGLGGTGLGGTAAAEGEDDRPPLGSVRIALRALGLVAWLVIGFRIGAQGIGGPIGIGIFVLSVVGVGLGARQITKR